MEQQHGQLTVGKLSVIFERQPRADVRLKDRTFDDGFVVAQAEGEEQA